MTDQVSTYLNQDHEIDQDALLLMPSQLHVHVTNDDIRIARELYDHPISMALYANAVKRIARETYSHISVITSLLPIPPILGKPHIKVILFDSKGAVLVEATYKASQRAAQYQLDCFDGLYKPGVIIPEQRFVFTLDTGE